MVKVVIRSPAVALEADDSHLQTKDKEEFRNYEDSYRHDIVYNRRFYILNRFSLLCHPLFEELIAVCF